MHTRVWVNKLCPVPGESFHSNHRRPILQMVADTCGVHDLLDRLLRRAPLPPLRHPGRPPQLRRQPARGDGALSSARRASTCPQPFNIFANVPIGADGSVLNGPPRRSPATTSSSRPGSTWIIAISACPQEFNPITGWYPTELDIEIMEPAEGDYD